MKLSRRLIPAFAMLLVSAVLMSTASFAWFSINDVVTAQGMTVTAKAESSLVINGSEDDTTYSSIGNNKISAALKPVTSKDGVNFGASKVKILAADKPQAEFTYTTTDGVKTFDYSNFGAPVTAPTTTSANDYVVTSIYNIKNIGGTVNVYVSDVEVKEAANSDKNLVTAVRVAVQLGTKVLVFNPNDGSLIDGKVGAYTAPGEGQNQGTWDLTAPDYATKGTTAVLGQVGEQGTQVKVYIWIEGQDTECYSDAIDATQFQVTVTFGATPVQQPAG